MKEKIDQIYSILKRIPVRTYVSFVLVVVAVINYTLVAAGRPIINLGEQEVTYAVNTIISIVAILYGVWKNNSVSEYAILCDQILYYLRDGKIDKSELEDFIVKHESDVPTEDTDAVEITETTDKIETVETENTEATDDEAKG